MLRNRGNKMIGALWVLQELTIVVQPILPVYSALQFIEIACDNVYL